MSEQIQTGSKKLGRGMAQASTALIAEMYVIASAAQPITGRGIGYKLFTRGLTPSMSVNTMQKVYRLLRIAREQGDIPWAWIVDETRDLERVSTWGDTAEYARAVARSYRRDFWDQQLCRVEVWSEKGTIRGVLKPILDKFAVGFRVMHGFTSATAVNDIVESDDGCPRVVLYVGDFDPSALFMSDVDLPKRLQEYGGDHVDLNRVALRQEQVAGLASFPAADKRKDPRHAWFVERDGQDCYEIDAMDPGDLRGCVEAWIKEWIEPEAWARCEMVNAAELESLQTILTGRKSGAATP